ncbi:MAG: MFS transporter [Clostridium sp.]
MRNLLSTYRGLPKEIYVIFIGKTVTCIGAFIHPLLSLILTQKIGLSTSDAGKFITLIAILQAPCIILGGKLSDIWGRKKVIFTFQGLSIFLYIICGLLEPSITQAYFIIAASCCSSAATPAYDALNGDLTNSKNRKASYSLIYMGVNLGFSIGPVLGGLFYNDYLWLIFIGDALTTLASLLLIMFFVNEPKRIKGDTVINESTLEKEESGSIFKVLFSRPVLILYALVMLTFQFGYSQWGFALPIQMGELFGSNGASYYGILGGLNGLLVVVLTPLITNITKKKNMVRVMACGGFLYALTFTVLSFSKILPMFFLSLIILTMGEVCISINSSAFLANNTPSSHRGRMNSLIPLIYGCGYAFGPTIMGYFLNNFSISIAWIVVSLIVFIGSIFMYFIVFKKSKESSSM